MFFKWKNQTEREQERLQRINRLESQLKKITDRMLSKPCPLNEGGLCFDYCVHFKQGEILGLHSSDISWIRISEPVCKLWGSIY
jgi:hypothetical protein